jgi:large subunit ribosomal protein L21
MNDYAIVKRGRHQYFLTKGKYLDVPKMKAEKAETITFDEVLLTNVGGKLNVGAPVVEKAVVTCKVVKHLKTAKEHGFKFKAKSRYRRHWGFRQHLTRLMVEDISVSN